MSLALPARVCLALLAASACHSDGDSVLEAPEGVEASDGTVSTHVIVRWSPSVGASAYRVFRDGELAGEVDTTSLIDGNASAPSIASPPIATATQGTETDRVVVRWSPATTDPGAVHEYTVTALDEEGESEPSLPDDGHRGAVVRALHRRGALHCGRAGDVVRRPGGTGRDDRDRYGARDPGRVLRVCLAGDRLRAAAWGVRRVRERQPLAVGAGRDARVRGAGDHGRRARARIRRDRLSRRRSARRPVGAIVAGRGRELHRDRRREHRVVRRCRRAGDGAAVLPVPLVGGRYADRDHERGARLARSGAVTNRSRYTRARWGR